MDLEFSVVVWELRYGLWVWVGGFVSCATWDENAG